MSNVVKIIKRPIDRLREDIKGEFLLDDSRAVVFVSTKLLENGNRETYLHYDSDDIAEVAWCLLVALEKVMKDEE